MKIENREFEVPPGDKRARKVISTSQENNYANSYLNTIMAFTNTSQEESIEDQHNFITLNSSTDLSAKVQFRSLSLTKKDNTTISWPEFIHHGDQVGLVTAAVLGDVTELIAEGTGVKKSQGAGLVGSGEDGVGADNFDKNSVYLI